MARKNAKKSERNNLTPDWNQINFLNITLTSDDVQELIRIMGSTDTDMLGHIARGVSGGWHVKISRRDAKSIRTSITFPHQRGDDVEWYFVSGDGATPTQAITCALYKYELAIERYISEETVNTEGFHFG